MTMANQYLQAKVYNLPEEFDKYVVARLDDTKSLWFWGSWEYAADAFDVAKEIGGVVLERMD